MGTDKLIFDLEELTINGNIVKELIIEDLHNKGHITKEVLNEYLLNRQVTVVKKSWFVTWFEEKMKRKNDGYIYRLINMNNDE